ncbi:hypothetical protein PR202_ga05980 [Eleusine coracana subsp. coracana]|uniref:WAT1-related protein n=1 Tax=Eleusine coracana subsp. coracana TaxID=191504 RepID=A0AAV5BTL5_ELECO|nr:hypothetical protein PR202_ga05980 [Eleusine coracana subsp. coracana]
MLTAARATTAREAVMIPLSMVAVQAFMVGMILLSKVALNAGMHPMVILLYRNLIAAATVAPAAIFFERKMLKKVDWIVLGWILQTLHSVVPAMGLYYYGLRTTSAAYSAIFINLIPIVTFVIAVLLRTEKLALGNWHGRTKLLGALLCVGGTMVVTLLKGHPLHLWPTGILKASDDSRAPANPAGAHHGMVAGTVFLCGSCVGYSLWLIVQSFLVGICISRTGWKLGWNLQLLTVVYLGIFNTGVTFVLISWAISRRGPIYPPMFNSLSLVVATILDSVLLGTSIYVERQAYSTFIPALGTLLVVLGLYAYLWGKGTEMKLAAAAEAAAAAQQEAGQHQRQGGTHEMTSSARAN